MYLFIWKKVKKQKIQEQKSKWVWDFQFKGEEIKENSGLKSSILEEFWLREWRYIVLCLHLLNTTPKNFQEIRNLCKWPCGDLQWDSSHCLLFGVHCLCLLLKTQSAGYLKTFVRSFEIWRKFSSVLARVVPLWLRPDLFPPSTNSSSSFCYLARCDISPKK